MIDKDFYKKQINRCIKDITDEYDCMFIFFMAIGSVGAIIAFVIFGCSSENLMEAYFAPRYFLVDKLLSLGK